MTIIHRFKTKDLDFNKWASQSEWERRGFNIIDYPLPIFVRTANFDYYVYHAYHTIIKDRIWRRILKDIGMPYVPFDKYYACLAFDTCVDNDVDIKTLSYCMVTKDVFDSDVQVLTSIASSKNAEYEEKLKKSKLRRVKSEARELLSKPHGIKEIFLGTLNAGQTIENILGENIKTPEDWKIVFKPKKNKVNVYIHIPCPNIPIDRLREIVKNSHKSCEEDVVFVDSLFKMIDDMPKSLKDLKSNKWKNILKKP